VSDHPETEVANLVRALTKVERREISDKRMIGAAMKLIAEKGVARTTLAEVGLASGYSRGLPVARFGSKLGLIETIVDFVDDNFAAVSPELTGNLRGIQAAHARIAAHIEAGTKSPIAAWVICHLYGEATSGFPELRPRMHALSESFAKGFETHLVEAQQDGEIAPDVDCKLIATIFVGIVRGIFVEWMLSDKKMDMKSVLPLIQNVTDGLLPVSSTPRNGAL